MKIGPIAVILIVVMLIVGFVAGIVASPIISPIPTQTITQTVMQTTTQILMQTVTQTVQRTVTATVTVEQKIDLQKLIYEQVDKFVNGIPVGKWYFYEVKDLKEKIDMGEKIFILDVREKAEWETGYIPGAVHIRLTELTDNLDKLPPEKDALIVVYCKVGLRGMIALSVLRILGYTNVFNLRGGSDAWVAAGYPLVKP
ncbi:MAG: rhodanese-like domain-containing protein [Nitrososphaeria archaeon]|nr:rhodanese-like domain-containing protein [Nitrososphaeria archaeon]